MKIFIQIPALPNNEFKVSAIKAIRDMSHPPLPLRDVKTMVETPGWHRIPNNMVEPLGMTKTDLRDYMERRSMDYETDVNAIYNYGGHIVFYLHNGEPAGYKPPASTPAPAPDLDSAGLRRPALTPKPLTQEQMNSMHVVFAILDHAIREAVSLGKYDEIPDIAKAAAFLLTLIKTKE